MERENEVVDHFRDFVVALVTSNPVHLRAVLTSLAQCFLGRKGNHYTSAENKFSMILEQLSSAFNELLVFI